MKTVGSNEEGKRDVLKAQLLRDKVFITRITSAILLSILLIFIDAGTPDASEKVALQLAWKHQFQFAGYYAALHKGYYKQAGLEVTLVEGGQGKFAREEVLSGRAQYGVAGAELLLHRRDGNSFVVLAPYFNIRRPFCLSEGMQAYQRSRILSENASCCFPEKKMQTFWLPF